MISSENRIVTQLLSTIYKDKNNPTILRVNVNNAVNILSNFGYNLPAAIFEKKLEELLNNKLVGAKITPAINYAMAQLILNLAEKVHIKEEDIINYLQTHNTKEYYGSLSKDQRQELINNLQDKLRPDVLEQIKKA